MLGKQLKLFTISPLVGSGLILWMPKGATVRGMLETFIKDELLKRGYQPVYTPHIGRLELYRTSGHFPYYRDAQFPPMYARPAAGALDLAQHWLSHGELDEHKEREMLDFMKHGRLHPARLSGAITAAEKLEAVHRYVLQLLEAMQVELPAYHQAANYRDRADALLKWLMEQEGYLLKPMNCPHHIQIYKAEPRSYRDLPVRLAEFGTVYRFEQTGELSGMTRVRGFTQDDAHLFVTPEQVEAEFGANIDLVLFVLTSLGLTDYRVRVGLRDPASDKYVGGRGGLGQGREDADRHRARARGMNYTAEPGEAAFYGPKIDFVVRDCIGREWQLGTVQLDYNLPKRFELEYVGADNHAASAGDDPPRPVRLDGALHGHPDRAFRRAPSRSGWRRSRCACCRQREVHATTAEKVETELKAAASACSGDYRPEKIGYKIREAQLEKIPYMLVVGEKEQTAGTVAVRCAARRSWASCRRTSLCRSWSARWRSEGCDARLG